MNNQDDHFFTRMSDVRKEIEEHVFSAIAKLLEEVLKDLEDLRNKSPKGGVLDIDKLALLVTKLDDRIKYLEMKEEEESDE